MQIFDNVAAVRGLPSQLKSKGPLNQTALMLHDCIREGGEEALYFAAPVPC